MALSHVAIQLIIWQAVFTILVTSAVVARFWTVKIRPRALRADDYMTIVSFVWLLMVLDLFSEEAN